MCWLKLEWISLRRLPYSYSYMQPQSGSQLDSFIGRWYNVSGGVSACSYRASMQAFTSCITGVISLCVASVGDEAPGLSQQGWQPKRKKAAYSWVAPIVSFR